HAAAARAINNIIPGADQCDIAVTGQRGGKPEGNRSDSVGGDKLAALLRPRAAAAGKRPGGARKAVVAISCDQRGFVVRRERRGEPKTRGPGRAAAGELVALLGPVRP